eukprot:gene10338-10495_t
MESEGRRSPSGKYSAQPSATLELPSGKYHGNIPEPPRGTSLGQQLRLVYEGHFVKGQRQGTGTCYYSTGEVYTGSWQANKRTGPGRLTYLDGSVFEGMWQSDRQHGTGTLQGPSGDVFVGTFVDDKRQGLGTTYMLGRGKKFVAEYVNNMPTCGTFYELDDDSVEAVPSQRLQDSIAAGWQQAAAVAERTGAQQGMLPVLQLLQPSAVLGKEFVAVRHTREQDKGRATAVQASCSTLASDQVNLLRHAFILMAGGDDLAAFVLPHQLQELMVLAGFDPAADAVVKLLANLGQAGCTGSLEDGRVSLEQFMHVVCHFREHPPTVVDPDRENGPSVVAQEAEEERVAAADLSGGGEAAGCEQDQEEEVWTSHGEQIENKRGVFEQDEDVLQKHIRAHQPPLPAVQEGSDG